MVYLNGKTFPAILEKYLPIYLFAYFTYFPFFAGSGVAARTPRREQAEGETSLRQKLLF